MNLRASRFQLALGLSAIVTCLLLASMALGLLPDADEAEHAGRVAVAETLAMSVTRLLGDEPTDVDDDDGLGDAERIAAVRELFGFVLQRQPALESAVLRRADGEALVALGMPPGAAAAPSAAGVSEATPGRRLPGRLDVPILRGRTLWGQAELQFTPLLREGAWGVLGGRRMLLMAGLGLGCLLLFHLYLARMLRHLDPSRAIPERVRNAFDALAEGVLVLDPRGRIVLVNRSLLAVIGGGADEWIGRRAAGLDWHAPGAGPAAPPWLLTLEDGRSRNDLLLYLVGSDGLRRSFRVNCSAILDGAGRAAGALVSLSDVTELERKEIELSVARDLAESANRAKSEFLANMSHEIRTPMNAILGFTELLRRGYRSGTREARRYLDIVHGSGSHLLALINDILDLSKVEAGRLEVERVPCALHAVVGEVVQVMKLKAQDQGLTLALELPARWPRQIATDPARVRQIVTNLIGNALKFTERGGVTVRLALEDAQAAQPRLVIEVQDSGIGIPADRLDAIFEPFVQAEASTTRHYGGTGLGLAISRRFARALGGDITVSATPGAGSCFRVTLLAEALDDADWADGTALLAESRDAGRSAEASHWLFEPATVLVVDDGAENRDLVRLVLEQAGLQVLQAEHGAQALEQVAAHDIALVLMDVQMPVMDGYTATRLLRERGYARPVLALTAHAMKGFEAEIGAAGFSGHLTKPVDLDHMLATLAAELPAERRPGPAPMSEPAEAPDPAARPVSAPDAGPAQPSIATPAPIPAPAPAPAATGSAAPIVSRLARHPRLARVARNFALQLPERLQAMHEATARADWDELSRLAHWLKGAGGTVGYDDFFEPARRLEREAQATDAGAVALSLRELQAMAQRLEIPDLVAAGSPAARPEPTPLVETPT